MSKTNLFGLLALGAMGLATGYASRKAKQNADKEDYAWYEYNKLLNEHRETEQSLEKTTDLLKESLNSQDKWEELYEDMYESMKENCDKLIEVSDYWKNKYETLKKQS